MRLVQAEVIPIKIPKRTAFTVAYATRTAALGLLIRLVADDGRAGWGEAVPVREITGEERPKVYGELLRGLPGFIGMDPLDREALRVKLERTFPHAPSARCGIDTALWDLRGQVLGQPVAKLLGGASSSRQASMSMGIKDLAETVTEARSLLAQGFGDIKVKIGLDLAKDIERVRALRAEFGAEFRLYLDANQGYTVEEAVKLVNALADEGIEFVEQPVKADDLEGLAKVTAVSPILIVADEAVKDPASLVKVLTRGAAHMVNIKLMKAGGPTPAELMVRMAEAFGLKAMIGCMLETRLGITAGLSVALALENVHYIDLDGYFDLVDDIVCAGGAQFCNGLQFLAEGPGLGLTVDAGKVARYRDGEVSA